jgi:hypothetical protein
MDIPPTTTHGSVMLTSSCSRSSTMICREDTRIPGRPWRSSSTRAKRVLLASGLTLVRKPPPLTERAGISNFNILKTKRILEVARIIPAVNQVEIHP